MEAYRVVCPDMAICHDNAASASKVLVTVLSEINYFLAFHTLKVCYKYANLNLITARVSDLGN